MIKFNTHCSELLLENMQVHYWSETRSDVCDKTLKHITGYSDADWAGDPVTRKAHLAHCVTLINFS